MAAKHPLVPVQLTVDVEPDGFFVRRDRPDAWLGFERGLAVMAEIREFLARRTGASAHFTWLVRADPQIEGVYGDAAWGLAHYREQLQALDAVGDEIGLHVHAYHWSTEAEIWVEDYGDQNWVAHCVRAGFAAFESTRGRRPVCFSMGMDWGNQATMEMVRELGVRSELSLISRSEPRPLRFLTGAYTGTAPDCRHIPRLPYPPAREDFRKPGSADAGAMWIFPLSSYVAALELSWKRRLYYRLRLQPIERRVRKFFLTDSPSALRPAIDEVLSSPQPYLTLSARTDRFRQRRSVAAMRDNLDYLLARTAGNVRFATPDEVLQLLDATPGNRRGIA